LSWTTDAQESQFLRVQQFRDKTGTMGDDDPLPDQPAQQLGPRRIDKSDRGKIEAYFLQPIKWLHACIPQFIYPGTKQLAFELESSA